MRLGAGLLDESRTLQGARAKLAYFYSAQVEGFCAAVDTDFTAMLGTILGTLILGVELGVAIGVLSSLALHLKRTSRPLFAIVGRMPGTEHYRNIKRHEVETTLGVLSIRIDESLFFPNARFLEDTINDAVSLDPSIREVVLMRSAVNFIDASALESLEQIDDRLKDAGLGLHLSEVKGPVLDRLQRTTFVDHLSGRVFLSQYEADQTLKGMHTKLE